MINDPDENHDTLSEYRAGGPDDEAAAIPADVAVMVGAGSKGKTMKFPLFVEINGASYPVGELRLRRDGTVAEISTIPDYLAGPYYTIRGEELKLVKLTTGQPSEGAAPPVQGE